MKNYPISLIGVILIVLFGNITQAQSFGTLASAVWISDCNQNNFYNTSGAPGNLIGPAGNTFDNANLGVHTQNSGTLILRGAQLRTFKQILSNVCSARMLYRVYPQSGAPGAFNSIDLPWIDDCDAGTGQFPSGGTCNAGDQKWHRVISDGTTVPYPPINLTAYGPGRYVVEVYYEASGSHLTPTGCGDTVILNNSGNNYKATFDIQAPLLTSANPSTCNGSEGSIMISGLAPGSVYQLSYTDDVTNVPPASYTANASGAITITNLNAGLYSNFLLEINGCATNLFTGIILSNPIFVTTFNTISSFCAGTTPPTLPTVSNNGIAGTWNPAVVDNQNSGTYTFTPNSGQCGLGITITINVIQRTTPTFSFGTSLGICAGGSVPVLPNTSNNGVNGTWSPAVVSNTTSGTYTFTPNAGQCANGTTFTVTVTPNATPTFDFGTSQTFCAGASVPVLPDTSNNGVPGTWSPAVIDNMNSGTYTFTPDSGVCAIITSLNVTIDPIETPTFSFGSTLSICSGGSVPTLPTTSNNGITGTWSPAVVSNTTSGTYTFTASAGECAVGFTLTVTVNPNITPTFPFGTAMTICATGSVPSLPNTSTNGITGTWNPAIVDNQNSATYTFTPDAGQCAVIATFTVTVTPPNITPTFTFGTSLSVCDGGTVPALPNTSQNGITGTWTPAAVDNQFSGTYSFTPDAGQCAMAATFSVTVNPIITPTFSFGDSQTICAGSTAPTLPTTSTNGITGTWNPSTVDNQNSATYTFTPDSGQCAIGTTFTVTITTNDIATFSFDSTLTICAGDGVPALPNTSDNGITGSWSPAVVSNQVSGIYTFTASGGCVLPFVFRVTVNPILTPTFSFGTSQSICIGTAVPVLSSVSTNGVSGTWSPAVVDNQANGTYTFTPDAGQCAVGTTFTLEVNVMPVLSDVSDTTVYDGAFIPGVQFFTSPEAATSWTNSNSSIGLAATGIGDMPGFNAINMTNDPVTSTITVTPFINGCSGAQKIYRITVLPLDKEIFIPNVFSPNDDGKNDKLFVYGNYINQIDMRIYNQWGQQIATITDRAQGWDGRHKGNPQPVGVYVYVCKVTLASGQTVNKKGSITLVR